MNWRRVAAEAAVGGAGGLAIVLAFAASRITGLEDLDHLGSATVGVLTVPLVILSFVLYRETQRTRIENSSPRLVLTIEPGRFFGFFDVVIANVGRGTAFDVATTLDPEIVIQEGGQPGTPLSQNKFISPPVLKPSQEFRLYLGRFEDLEPHVSRARIRYTDERGAVHTDENNIDLRTYEAFGTFGPDDYLAEISKHVEAVATTLKRVVGTDRLRVDTFDNADRGRQEDRRAESRRKFRATVQAQADQAQADQDKP